MQDVGKAVPTLNLRLRKPLRKTGDRAALGFLPLGRLIGSDVSQDQLRG